MSCYNLLKRCAEIDDMDMIDTIGIGINRSVAEADNLILAELVTIIELNAIKGKFSVNPNRTYSIVKSFKFKGKHICIRYFKTIRAYCIPDYQITIHLSQFKNWSSFKKWFHQLVGKFFKLLMTKADIFRLDCCLETQIWDLMNVFHNVNRKYASIKNVKYYGAF